MINRVSSSLSSLHPSGTRLWQTREIHITYFSIIMICVDLLRIPERLQKQHILILLFDSVREAFSAHIPKYGFRFACALGQAAIILGSIAAFLCVKMSSHLSIVSYYLRGVGSERFQILTGSQH